MSSSFVHRAAAVVLVGLLAPGFALQQEEKGRVTINNACRVYHPTCVGNAKTFKKVAVVTSRKFFDATSEYKQIARRKLKPNTAEWCFLAKAASDKFRTAIEKTAKGGGYDLIAEHGAITVSSLALLCALAVAPACCGSRDAPQVCRTLFSQPVPMTASARREFDLTQEGRRYEYPDIENADGSVTRIIWVQEGQAAHLIELLKGHDAFVALQMKAAHSGVVRDALPLPPGPGGTPPQVASNEALMLKGTREQVQEATDLVNYVLTSIPQI
jgi:hypothetical protein